jgi:hypothetical protein
MADEMDHVDRIALRQGFEDPFSGRALKPLELYAIVVSESFSQSPQLQVEIELRHSFRA